MKQTFYSNGKLLLTGEYVVLDGAKSLALPTKYGQDLTVESGENKQISWKSFDSDGSVWFEDVITFGEILAVRNPHEIPTIKHTLTGILHQASLLNPNLIQEEGFHVETHLTFPKFWGLGTSSTLINNIAQWFGIDAFELLKNSFGGSGYDIACGQNDTPIIYQIVNDKPTVEQVAFHPEFAGSLYFVYLNKKQSSKEAIASYYNNKVHELAKKIAAIDRITTLVINAPNVGVFARALEKHESIISDIVEMETVKEAFFKDFKGVVKSLGGWGGDFILAISKDDPTDYFRERGFGTVVSYDDMVLK
ncbi:MAG TPA: GYDIA family GHMP kinase [Flavobacterium sp.]|nr:GYDIA family GHMP kinase [Flavobacterium sp.]